TVAENAPAAAIAVLANDTDADDGPKSIASATDPANGTVVITGGGSGLTYAPDPGYCNSGPPPGPTDDFTYTLSPGGDTATVAVRVDCAADPAGPAADFNGDGFADRAVGVPLEDVGSVSDAGVVNVIYGSATGLTDAGNQVWNQSDLGGGETAEAGDQFGRALTTGDFNQDGFADLAVGAPFENVGSAADAGTVNVIYGSASGLTSAGNQLWHQNSPGIPEAADAGDSLGGALASGDLNGDAVDDLAIGVPSETVGTTAGAGAVNTIYGSASGLTSAGSQIWNQNSAAIAEASEAGDLFGAAVAAGDLNGDARDDLAIGAPSESVGSTADAGSVNVIYGSGSGLSGTGNQLWHQNQPSILELGDAGDAFGAALASGDLNGDARDDLAIGVPSETVGTTPAGAGAVNTIYGSASGLTSAGNQLWHQGSPGIAEALEAGESLGAALGIGAFDGNAFDDLAIGVPLESVGTVAGAGAMNVIYGSGSGLFSTGNQLWSQDSPNILEAGEASDRFGAALGADAP
ncbi:MAG: Ig-like domain-containing protein, partial [Actinomycetota bacterium]|nr:Ig-like domain-containing protein [Actinomycetota bacterium]